MSKDGFGSAEGQHGPYSTTFNHIQSAPVITPPERSHRNQIGNHLKQTSEDLTDEGNSVVFTTKSDNYGLNNANTQSSAKHAYHSDQNSEVISSSSSVVINFDTGNFSVEPSTPNSVDSLDISSDGLFPDQCNSEQYQSDQYNSEPFNSEQYHLDISDASSSSENLETDSEDRITSGPSNNELLVAESNGRSSEGSFINIGRILAVINNSIGTQTRNGNLRSPPNSCTLDKIFHEYTPFVTFVCMRSLYDHREGIFIFLGLLITFIHANSVIKREVSKQNRRSPLSLGIIFVNLVVSIGLIYFVFQDEQLYKVLIFTRSNSQLLTLWDLLWIVGVTDFILKFITMLLKVGLVCFPAHFLPYSSRGKWYLALERTSQLYRSLIPIPPWLHYLMQVYRGTESTEGMAFCATYVIIKGSEILNNIKHFVKAFWKLFHHTIIGTRPNEEQMVFAGSQCPICHDEYNAPIMLQCSHVFCEGCVLVWFDREQTCPLCRAKIADDPSWRDGATSFFVYFF